MSTRRGLRSSTRPRARESNKALDASSGSPLMDPEESSNATTGPALFLTPSEKLRPRSW